MTLERGGAGEFRALLPEGLTGKTPDKEVIGANHPGAASLNTNVQSLQMASGKNKSNILTQFILQIQPLKN